MSNPQPAKRGALLLWLTVGLLIATALATRLPSPWRLEVTNDEAHHHLESWRNRYGSPSVFPVFFDRLQQTHQHGRLVQHIEALYHAHPEMVARSLFVVIDPQPPLWPVTAELIEALTHSSLVAQRIPALLASLGAIWLAFLIGKRLRDVDLGLWTAALFTIGLLSQLYAGIARPYAIAQCFVLAVVYSFVLQRQRNSSSIWRFLLVALLAQSTQWMAWAVVGVFVAVEFFCQFRQHRSLLRLARQSWWYILLSLLLLCEMAVQLKNPTISNQAHRPGFAELLGALTWASPFSQAAVMAHEFSVAAAVATLLLTIASFAVLLWTRTISDAYIRWGIALACAGSILAPLLLGASTRFLMTYLVVPTIVVAIGVHWFLAVPAIQRTTLALLLLLFGSLSLLHLAHPYRYKVWDEPRFSLIAHQLKAHLTPNAVWLGYPYFFADDLYRYGPLPEPMLPQSQSELASDIQNAWRKGKPVLVVAPHMDLPPVFNHMRMIADFGELALFELPVPPDTAPSHTPPASTSQPHTP